MSLPGFRTAVHSLLGRETALREAAGKRALAELITGARRDPELFQAAAERHGVFGLIFEGSAAATVLQGRAMRALKFSRRAVEAVEAAGIACVVLKGSAAAARWRVPLARQQSDLDLLVDPANLRAASRALIAAGVASREFMAGDHVHNASLAPATRGGLTIELHYALNSNHEISVDIAALISRRIFHQTAQGQIPGLSAEDDAAYLAMHAATHALSRLAWLVDLEGVSRTGVDWVEAARRARAWNVALPVECAWRHARDLLAVPIPEQAFAALGTAPVQRSAVEALYQATWGTAGQPHKWLERAFRLALVRPSSWPALAVHKFRARQEQIRAYYPNGMPDWVLAGSLPNKK